MARFVLYHTLMEMATFSKLFQGVVYAVLCGLIPARHPFLSGPRPGLRARSYRHFRSGPARRRAAFLRS